MVFTSLASRYIYVVAYYYIKIHSVMYQYIGMRIVWAGHMRTLAFPSR
jgi:hypothetical protein